MNNQQEWQSDSNLLKPVARPSTAVVLLGSVSLFSSCEPSRTTTGSCCCDRVQEEELTTREEEKSSGLLGEVSMALSEIDEESSFLVGFSNNKTHTTEDDNEESMITAAAAADTDTPYFSDLCCVNDNNDNHPPPQGAAVNDDEAEEEQEEDDEEHFRALAQQLSQLETNANESLVGEEVDFAVSSSPLPCRKTDASESATACLSLTMLAPPESRNDKSEMEKPTTPPSNNDDEGNNNNPPPQGAVKYEEGEEEEEGEGEIDAEHLLALAKQLAPFETTNVNKSRVVGDESDYTANSLEKSDASAYNSLSTESLKDSCELEKPAATPPNSSPCNNESVAAVNTGRARQSPATTCYRYSWSKPVKINIRNSFSFVSPYQNSCSFSAAGTHRQQQHKTTTTTPMAKFKTTQGIFRSDAIRHRRRNSHQEGILTSEAASTAVEWRKRASDGGTHPLSCGATSAANGALVGPLKSSVRRRINAIEVSTILRNNTWPAPATTATAASRSIPNDSASTSISSSDTNTFNIIMSGQQSLNTSATSESDLEDIHFSGSMESEQQPFKMVLSPSLSVFSVPVDATGSKSMIWVAPSAASTEASVPQKNKTKNNSSSSQVLVDLQGKDYRSFLFVVHDKYGLMLLHCTRKKKKPAHWQLPGGHIDELEFAAAAQIASDAKSQLLLAAKAGAARELYEETGIDVRSSLERLEPSQLREEAEEESSGRLENEFKQRLFFFLPVTDEDFCEKGTAPQGSHGKQLKLKLSIEHSGFTFQPEPTDAAEMLKAHSGGKVSEALLMAMNRKAALQSTTATTMSAAVSSAPSAAAPLTEPPVPRRAKREKYEDFRARSFSDDGTDHSAAEEAEDREPIELMPKPEKKSMFCCWHF